MPRPMLFILPLAVMCALPGAALAQATLHDTVAAASRIVGERYVLPEVAPRLAAALSKGEASGHYRGKTGDALAEAMSADLHAVTADRHLSVRYDPAEAALLAAGHPDDHALPPGYARLVAMHNAGVRALEILPGNIRTLAYDGYIWGTPEASEALASAMQFLKGGDAMIIDLRRNGGGSPEAVAAMASYFLPAGTPLARFEMRGAPGETSAATATPFSLAGKPLYVLTSGGTASAAEEFATHVSAFDFGTLIGATTAGAGFRNETLPLPGGYVLSVSIGRPVHAKTGGNWEAKGVAPKIAVPAQDAMARARVEAMQAVLTSAPVAEQADDKRLLAYYRAVATPIALVLPVAAYAGRYGERVVFAEAGGLAMQRGERMPVRLIAVAPDRFVAESDPTVEYRFETADGRVTAMAIDRGAAGSSRFPRL